MRRHFPPLGALLTLSLLPVSTACGAAEQITGQVLYNKLHFVASTTAGAATPILTTTRLPGLEIKQAVTDGGKSDALSNLLGAHAFSRPHVAPSPLAAALVPKADPATNFTGL